MNKLSAKIVSHLRSKEVELADRNTAITYMASRCISSNLHLPTSTVENPFAYFRMTHTENIMEEINKINEDLVVDVDGIQSLISKMWILRYRLVHEPYSPQVRDVISTLIASGVSDIPKQYSELATKYDELRLEDYAPDLFEE